MSSHELQADVERRIALACDFITAAIDDSSLLEVIPDGAYVAIGDRNDPAFTGRSRALLSSPAIRAEADAADARRGTLMLSPIGDSAKTADFRLVGVA